MAKIAIIISFKNFRDEEYFIPKEIFENNGFEVKTISTEKGIAIGGDGGEAEVDLCLSHLDIDEFDALVFVGGPGAYAFIEDESVWHIIRQARDKGKFLAAICIAPAILAKAGVLEGKKATIWSSSMDKKPIKILQENGAEYIDKAVVQDGKIITANGPSSAEEFGKSIVQHLTNNPKFVII
ncbi:DJ-1/PfpI family protein [Patescibacteria group bacterium]|nr:DJ-1/PfpI family protein [Patescibacteria group bacterium]MBU4023075.1 DJ-1/PfpI family protein [Patescibacteria group bacterium]